jgi:hypothetical protein
MFVSSFLDVFGIHHDDSIVEDIQIGDLVRTGANAYPRFTVVALSNGTAWVRNVENGVDGFAPLGRCRKLQADAALRLAAE